MAKAVKKTTKKVVAKVTKKEPLSFKTAFKYPFNRAKGMLNILWLFLPIIGWFALGGYFIRIIQEFSNGKFKQLPEIRFGEDFSRGVFMFLKAIPFVLVYMMALAILSAINDPLMQVADMFISIFILPILFVNFFNKETVGSLFEFDIISKVFSNFVDYLIVFLKGFGLAMVFVVMILILVGIPALAFTHGIFVADFYRRYVKK